MIGLAAFFPWEGHMRNLTLHAHDRAGRERDCLGRRAGEERLRRWRWSHRALRPGLRHLLLGAGHSAEGAPGRAPPLQTRRARSPRRPILPKGHAIAASSAFSRSATFSRHTVARRSAGSLGAQALRPDWINQEALGSEGVDPADLRAETCARGEVADRLVPVPRRSIEVLRRTVGLCVLLVK